jgi:ribosomal protein L30/L7E
MIKKLFCLSQNLLTKKFFSTTKIIKNETKNLQEVDGLKKRGNLIFVTLIKSPKKREINIKKSVKALMLRKKNQTQVHRDTPLIRGLIYKSKDILRARIVSTAEFFPNGTEHLKDEIVWKSKQDKLRERKEKIQEIKLKKLEIFFKKPSKNNIKINF